MQVNKIPPQNKEAEQAIIGTMLLSNEELIPLIVEAVSADDFFYEYHRALFNALMELYNEGSTIDLITITDKLSNEALEAIGGTKYLTDIIKMLPVIGPSAIKDYIRIIKEAAGKRHFINEFTTMVYEVYENQTDIATTINRAESTIYDMAIKGEKKELKSIGSNMDALYNEIENNYQNKGEVVGVPTGFRDLDQKTLGLANGSLIVVAARPSMGKTAFMQAIAQHAAVKANITAAIFSIEMTSRELEYRFLSSQALINSNVLKNGDLKDNDFEKMAHAYSVLGEAPIYIDDTATITLSEIRSKCRRLKVEKNLGLILIDYLQLIQAEGKPKNRTQELSEITQGMKKLAKELGVPIVLLSQLSRAPEMRVDHRPILSDLRESGAIEQDADTVMFLYRDEYYNPDTDKKNISEVIIAKQRNGATGSVELVWLGQFTKFADKLRYEDR